MRFLLNRRPNKLAPVALTLGALLVTAACDQDDPARSQVLPTLDDMADGPSAVQDQTQVDPAGKIAGFYTRARAERPSGSMYAPMYNELRHMKDNELRARQRTVLVKLKVKENFIDKSASKYRNNYAQLKRDALKEQRRVENEATALLNETLRELGADTVDARPLGPFVSARLPATLLLKLAKHENISFVGPIDEQETPEEQAELRSHPFITDALESTGTQWLQRTNGLSGDRVRIATMEPGKPNLPLDCFNIAEIQLPNAPVDPVWDPHLTGSLGIIGNADADNDGRCSGQRIGYAPGAEVLVANHNSFLERLRWAQENDAEILTISLTSASERESGELSARDVLLDHWSIHFPYTSVFTAAGNHAQTQNRFAAGKGFNFFGVGNIQLQIIGEFDQEMSSSSSFLNPTTENSDREIPEIAAPGSRHRFLNRDFGGTSAATPVTASIAALLLERKPLLKYWPEAVRAIILASPNYEDADGARWDKDLDGKDGAGMIYGPGAIDAIETSETADKSEYSYDNFDYGTITSRDFDSKGVLKKKWRIGCSNYNRVKVAFTWNSRTEETSSELDVDLDLIARNPTNNKILWRSRSTDSNIEFKSISSNLCGDMGRIDLEVKGYGIPDDLRTYFGIAWTNQRSRGAPPV